MGHWRSLYRYSATSLRSSGGSGSPPRFRREREANPLRVSLVPIAELDDVNSRGDPQLPGHREPAMPHAAFVLNRRKVLESALGAYRLPQLGQIAQVAVHVLGPASTAHRVERVTQPLMDVGSWRVDRLPGPLQAPQ